MFGKYLAKINSSLIYICNCRILDIYLNKIWVKSGLSKKKSKHKIYSKQLFATNFDLRHRLIVANQEWLLSPLGDLGMGLVWDNHQPCDFFVWVLKSFSNWTKLTVTGSQMKFFTHWPPARKRREILWWAIKGEKSVIHRGTNALSAKSAFWPCFACPKLGDAGRRPVAQQN